MRASRRSVPSSVERRARPGRETTSDGAVETPGHASAAHLPLKSQCSLIFPFGEGRVDGTAGAVTGDSKNVNDVARSKSRI